MVGAVTLAGCPKNNEPAAPAGKGDAPATRRTSVALRLTVVNDERLAEAVGRLRGEWAERFGGTLATRAVAWDELVAGEPADADVLVFASRYLGELCEKQWLRPVRENVLQSDAFRAADIFPLVRERLLTYDKKIFAVPLGIDLPVMCYRSDALDRQPPPRSWSEYLALIRAHQSTRDGSASSPAWEPVGNWGAVLLLTRVASYLSPRQQFNALFDYESMKPAIAGPVFVRALQELRDATNGTNVDPKAASVPDRNLQDPRSAAWHLAGGDAQLMAIGLPPAGRQSISPQSSQHPGAADLDDIRWTHAPGADQVIESSQDWRQLEQPRYSPLLGSGDRLAAVTSSTRNAASAFELLTWLAEADVSSQFARAGGGTMPVRPSLAKAAGWYDEKLTAQERDDLADVLRDSLAGEDCLVVPRIPGVDEYMAALGKAVEDVVIEHAEPQAALRRAAGTWELITEKRGRAAQRQAFLRHLGIDAK